MGKEDDERLIGSVSGGPSNASDSPLPTSYLTDSQSSLLQTFQFEPNLAGYRNWGIQAPGVGITWNNLIVTSKNETSFLNSCFGIGSPPPEERTILSGLSGCAVPGTLLAIMGSSGAGKSTFLNCLANRNTSELRISGEIEINGRLPCREMKNVMAYVQQDDLFFGSLKVREHLLFQARMRMDRNTSKAERIERVENLLLDLGLKKCENSFIGQPGVEKCLSGGERKRLAFATEILTDPPIVFCDEPTSGLDSFMALNVISILYKMAARGKNVICTIHQPSSEVFAMFDRLLLLAEGRTVYLGPAYEALDFFNSIGHLCPSTFNPADYYVHLLAVHPGFENRDRTIVHGICDKFESSVYARELQSLRDNLTRASSLYQDQDLYFQIKERRIRWWTQIGPLFRRAFLDSVRNPAIMKIRTMQKIFLALIIGFCYFGISLNQEGIASTSGAIFIFITENTFPNLYGVLHTFPKELPVVLRENRNGTYRIDVYYLTKILALIPGFFIEPILFTSICYWMIGLHGNIVRFAVTTGILVLTANAASACGFFFSAAFENYSMALSVLIPFDVILMTTGGIFININTLPSVISWTQYFSWFRYSYEAIMITQWDQIHNITCGHRPDIPCITEGTDVLEDFGFKEEHLWWNLTFLGVMYGAYHTLGMIALLIRSRR